MPEIKAVIIDVDDTLCLTEAACFDLENETLVAMGRPAMERTVHVNTWGQPLFDAIAVRSPGIDVEEFKVVYHPIIDEYTKSGKLDAIPQENYEALDKLIAWHKMLMILTSRTFGEAKHMLEPDHLLSTRIAGFYHKDKTKYHKPDKRVFDEVLNEHGLLPEECVYVGDSVSDAAATKDRGMLFVASLESGLRVRQDFREYQVDRFINRFAELPEAIASLEAA